jgi:hypothetical protein
VATEHDVVPSVGDDRDVVAVDPREEFRRAGSSREERHHEIQVGSRMLSRVVVPPSATVPDRTYRETVTLRSPPVQAGTMSDTSDDREGTGSAPSESEESAGATGAERETGRASGADSGTEDAVEALRQEVEERYDFEEFTPDDMAEMDPEEWEAVFDPETWITGAELLDRIETDLRRRVAERDVFAVIERPEEERVVAYSDRGYAAVHGSGRVEGEGAILREVEPIVALCAMEEYEVTEPAVDRPLPDPEDVDAGSGRLGHILLQAVAATQVLGGVGLLVAPVFTDLAGEGTIVLTTAAGLGFLVFGVVLFVLVANARLSGRFQAEEYRERLAAAGVGSAERPDFVPIENDGSGAEESKTER